MLRDRYLFSTFVLDENILGLDIPVKISLGVKSFKAKDDLGQDFGSFVEGKDFVLKFSLVVDEISPVAILQDKVDETFIFLHIFKPDDVARVHAFHAVDLSVEIVPEVRFGFDHLDCDEFECVGRTFFIFNQVDVSVGSLAQPPFVPVLFQKHELI